MEESMLHLAYPVELETDEGGRVVARVPDLPGCVTDGADRAEALREAADALEEALAALIDDGQAIPLPSDAGNRPVVAPGAVMAAKTALYLLMRQSGVSKVQLAARLGIEEKEVRRMLDPRHSTKIGRLEAALASFGRRLVVTVEEAWRPAA
jgi:antitoxin HicB